MAKCLADEANVDVQMIDLQGYGLSGGGRCMANFHQLQSNIAKLFSRINPEKPIFLFGHSMGGGKLLFDIKDFALTSSLPTLSSNLQG